MIFSEDPHWIQKPRKNVFFWILLRCIQQNVNYFSEMIKKLIPDLQLAGFWKKTKIKCFFGKNVIFLRESSKKPIRATRKCLKTRFFLILTRFVDCGTVCFSEITKKTILVVYLNGFSEKIKINSFFGKNVIFSRIPAAIPNIGS